MVYELGPAIEALQRALQRDPSNGIYHYACAALLALDGDLQGAVQHLHRAEQQGVDVTPLREWLRRKRGSINLGQEADSSP
jgi:lipopolysaccharide biosynthesis regulator YciM